MKSYRVWDENRGYSEDTAREVEAFSPAGAALAYAERDRNGLLDGYWNNPNNIHVMSETGLSVWEVTMRATPVFTASRVTPPVARRAMVSPESWKRKGDCRERPIAEQ